MRMSMALSSLLLLTSSRTLRAFQTSASLSRTRTSTLFQSPAFIASSATRSQKLEQVGSTSTRARSRSSTQRYSSTSTRTIDTNSPSINISIEQEQETETQVLPSKQQPPLQINLLTIHEPDLEEILASWNQPKYRAKQILTWVRTKGVTQFSEMNNIPKQLRSLLEQHTTIGSLHLELEALSKDGTIKRAYKLWDGQLIESVLMPYEDGRNTACISSQAGCAMGCVFCATGQMGFARQLTPDEIFEQVARFAAELSKEDKRLSNIVMMGMGEPLANYRNVMEAIKRMNSELGIGARKITVSTVGVVPNIRKLIEEDIQVRLAVSLHCSSDEERTQLLPANKRYGGLDELMMVIKEYIDTTNRRVTLEWALIENENDTPEVARQLGHLLKRFGIRRDMTHVNLIPLNPTGGFEGGPSGRKNVNEFVNVLEKEFGITATPRMRRGIDIDAGCGQLKAAVKKKEDKEATEKRQLVGGEPSALDELKAFAQVSEVPAETMSMAGVWEDVDEDVDDTIESVSLPVLVVPAASEISLESMYTEHIRKSNSLANGSIVEFELLNAVNLDDEDADEFEDETYENDLDKREAERLISLVKISFPQVSGDEMESPLVGPTTTIMDEDSVNSARKRRKKILKNLKAINNLKKMVAYGKEMNEDQVEKIGREKELQLELESVEHNLQ